MGSRKRGRDEMEASEPAPESTMLDRLRNTWEFSNIMQYIYIFGRVVKIDEDLTIEVLSPIEYSIFLVTRERLSYLMRHFMLIAYQLRTLKPNVSNLNHPQYYLTSVWHSSNMSRRIEA